ncbi:MAG: hypothetical protein Q8M16_05460 [Pirellulaceae bacterium]|nr:hypothetical protein [Pirellulaceae bacterium]
MEYLEFHCSECRCGLRIRAEHREKTIRCPNCHALQRYNPTPETPVHPFVDQPAAPGQIDQGTWSLKMSDGIILGNLSREAFESEVRARNLGPGTFFQGGDFSQWTPLERLFQSQVPGKADKFGGGWAGHTATGSTPIPIYAPTENRQPTIMVGTPVSAPGPGSAAYVPQGQRGSASIPTGALPLEQQLPAPRSHLVLTMGILGLCLPCLFIFSLIGVVMGILDTMQMGNGTMSQKGSTMLTIGLVLSILGLFTGGCCTISILSG